MSARDSLEEFREAIDSAYKVVARIDDDTYEAEGFNPTTRVIDQILEPYARALIFLNEDSDERY